MSSAFFISKYNPLRHKKSSPKGACDSVEFLRSNNTKLGLDKAAVRGLGDCAALSVLQLNY